MNSNPQIERYKKLLTYIEEHLNEDINIEKVEEICHYSYRNINRIFEAIHQETIGKYIKRLRLEKAAQYLKYSDMGVSQIAYTVGFEDRSAFSKAFKKRYNSSPQSYRDSSESIREERMNTFLLDLEQEREKIPYEIEFLPAFQSLFIEYRGDYNDLKAIDKQWEVLFEYAHKKGLLSDESIFMTEIVDDAEISDHINSRYNLALIFEQPLDFTPDDLIRTKKHQRQKYAKFTHQGSHQSCTAFYHKIYAFWMLDVGLELADQPLLEFYPNYEENLPEDQLITEIYIPVV